MRLNIPKGAKRILDTLERSGHKAYVVGGCVRDSLLSHAPDDWDICTSAKPDEVISLFTSSGFKVIPTGIRHGTVTIIAEDNDSSQIQAEDYDSSPIPAGTDLSSETYEVTTFRVDGKYKANRRPEYVVFVSDVKEDLARRDFTVNAMAYNHTEGLIDPFGGQADLSRGIIRCVGDPDKRFDEDALRILRGIRFASQLGFAIENNTADSLMRKASLLDNIAAERIRVEFDKLLAGREAARILGQYRRIIAQFIPEVRAMFGLDQENPFHIYDVWTHTLHAVRSIGKAGSFGAEDSVGTDDDTGAEDSVGTDDDTGAEDSVGTDDDTAADDSKIKDLFLRVEKPDLILYLAAFFHDIGKPPCKVVTNGWGHFYGHEKTSAEMTNAIMRRLKYDNETRKTVVRLIAKHGIVFNPAGKQARRLLHHLGEKDLRRLIALERADVSAQHPDYVEERLANISEFEKRVDELIASDLVFSMNDMEISGKDLINMGIPQGKEIGRIKSELLRMIVDGELENDYDVLMKQAKELL